MDLNKIYDKYNLSDRDPNDSSFFVKKFGFNEVEKTWFFGITKTKNISYINLALILKYIEKNQNLFVSNNDSTLKLPYLKFDISRDNFMLTFYSHISADPRICLIPNNKLVAFKIPEIISEFSEKCPNEYIGRVMNLLINIEYLGSILFELSNEKGEIILDSFLKRMLDDINKCLGGINQLTYKVFDNTVKIIEEAPLKYENLKIKQTYSRFNVYGVRPNEGSFVKNIDFNVTITNDMATMISVGAQANGNQPGINSTAFSKFNTGLIDRTKTQITTDPGDPDPKKDTAAETEYKEANKKYKDAVYNVYFDKKLTPENIEILNNFNSDFSKKYVGTLVESEQIPAPSFLPFDLNLTMLGLSGIKIFEKFALTEGSEKILPPYYRDNNGKSLIDFIVLDLKHSIKDSKWETIIKGRSVPSETSLEPKPVTKFTLDQATIQAGLQATSNLTRIPRPNEGYPNANTLRQIISSLQYQEKGNEIDNGGDITPELVVAAETVLRELKTKLNSQYYSTIIITAGNDLYHQRLGYISTHTQGKAFDFVINGVPPMVNRNTVLNDIVNILTPLKARGIIKVFIDEYRNPTGASTGGHFHINI